MLSITYKQAQTKVIILVNIIGIINGGEFYLQLVMQEQTLYTTMTLLHYVERQIMRQ